MYVPFFSRAEPNQLHRRKGGGGRGGGGGGRSGSCGSKGSASSSKPTVNFGGASKTATLNGQGGGRSSIIPAGQPFAGRIAGGGGRSEVVGASYYGSGYPGEVRRGVANRGFPFYFWPIVWVSAVPLIASSDGYLYASGEYGLPGNTARPGGVMVNAAFQSNATGSIYRVISDNATVLALIPAIKENCTRSIGNVDSFPVRNWTDSSQAQPEQAIRYYRASSLVLTLDGYNNSAVFEPEGAPDSELPENIDRNLLDCINGTIGRAVPLIDDARRTTVALKFASYGLTMIGLVLLLH